jgi:putative ABC transport system permease protein
MGTLWQDLRFGARVLLRQPVFTFVAVLTLALGIGANTAIFSVINAVLINPLPFPEQERLVDLYETFKPNGFGTLSVPNLRDWQQQNTTFAGIAAYAPGPFNLQAGDSPQRLQGLRVQANYFDVLQLKPQLGRTFLPGEDEAGRDRVVIISDALWRDSFGADPEIVNKTLPLNGASYTVIGVMPRSLSTLTRSQVWAPLVFSETEKSARGNHSYSAIGRLKAGVTLEQARAELNAIAAHLERAYPDAQTGRGAMVNLYEERIVGGVRQPLFILMAAVAFVLLIACANVANLLLARAAGRYREIAVRIALGAGRLRLVRQFVTEGVLLAFAGGVVGVGAAWLGLDVLGKLAFAFVPRSGEIKLDPRVLGFTLLVSILTGVIFGIAPAAQAFKTNVQEALKDGGSSVGLGGAGLRSALVIAEIAAAFVLLTGAGLLIKSFMHLRSVDTGLRPEHVLTAKLSLPTEKYADGDARTRFHQQLLERITRLPGVEAAGITSHLAVEEYGTNGNTPIEGKSYPPNQEPLIEYRVVSPDYFRALGISLLRGRSFDEHDTKDSPPVVIINEAMAREVWGTEDPIGKRIFGDPWVAVIGVVSDVKNVGLTQRAQPELYLNYTQGLSQIKPSATLVVRSRLDPATLTAVVRREVQAVDPAQPIFAVQTMQAVLDSTVSDRRLNMTLLGVFAALSLMLAVIGIYGVMSYTVAQHTHEIGIRMALGAQAFDILKLVVGRGLFLTALGIAVGVGGSLALTRFIVALLFEVQATDVANLVIIAALLTTVALLACFIPALRATRVDPMIALRHE